jgi:hypothetical protein
MCSKHHEYCKKQNKVQCKSDSDIPPSVCFITKTEFIQYESVWKCAIIPSVSYILR